MAAELAQLPGEHEALRLLPPLEPLTAEDLDYIEQRMEAQAEGWPEGYRKLPQGEDQ